MLSFVWNKIYLQNKTNIVNIPSQPLAAAYIDNQLRTRRLRFQISMHSYMPEREHKPTFPTFPLKREWDKATSIGLRHRRRVGAMTSRRARQSLLMEKAPRNWWKYRENWGATWILAFNLQTSNWNHNFICHYYFIK